MHERDDDPAPDAPSRGDADRPVDDALAALRQAAAPKPELPPLAPGFDDRHLAALSEAWRLLPEEPEKEIDLGTGWRRRLRDVAWRLLRPILDRQQQFNLLLVRHLGGNLRAVNEGRESAADVIAALDRHLGSLAEFQSRLVHHLSLSADERRAATKDLHALHAKTDDLRAASEGLRESVHHLGVSADEQRAATKGLHARTDDLRAASEGLQESVDALERTTEGMSQSVDLATASTHGLKREVERLRGRPAAPPGPPASGSPAPSRPDPPEEIDLDACRYMCFEDVFRGSREEIAARQRDYLPHFEGAADVLDVGCGRGEFLALLRDEGIAARGVDANADAVERCRERGLEAARSDALAYLRTLADESIGGLFSAQVVEHLEADYLMQVLGDAHRVLRPGSRIVLETINPASWTAFFSAFVRDVTHRHPLHPDTLGYLLRASGFVDVTIDYRAPVPDAAKLQRAMVDPALAAAPGGAAVRHLAETLNQHADRLNHLIFAEQDYAAIARRP